MCRPDSCWSPPVCVNPLALPAARRFDLVWSRSIPGNPTGWGESTGAGEQVTSGEWASITGAALASSAAMLGALNASAAAPAWARAEAKAMAHGGQPAVDDLVALMHVRAKKWNGKPLDW